MICPYFTLADPLFVISLLPFLYWSWFDRFWSQICFIRVGVFWIPFGFIRSIDLVGDTVLLLVYGRFLLQIGFNFAGLLGLGESRVRVSQNSCVSSPCWIGLGNISSHGKINDFSSWFFANWHHLVGISGIRVLVLNCWLSGLRF